MDDLDKLESNLNLDMKEIYDEFLSDLTILFKNERERKKYFKNLSKAHYEQLKDFTTTHVLAFYQSTKDINKINQAQNLINLILKEK